MIYFQWKGWHLMWARWGSRGRVMLWIDVDLQQYRQFNLEVKLLGYEITIMKLRGNNVHTS